MHIIKVICQPDMFLYEDKSYIIKSGFEAQKIGATAEHNVLVLQ